MSSPTDDPILVKRAKIARYSALGKRIGYSLYLIAVGLFFVGLAAGFDDGIATAIIICMGVGALLLAPAIVFAYGVKAAERDEAAGPTTD